MPATPAIHDFLDPAVLARIDNYSLLARTVVEGFISGLHRSLYHGFGSEFVQYRNYTPGDDLKYVDWKVYARHERYQIKVMREETNTNCSIVLDLSSSMGYQGAASPVSKLHYAKMIVASLALLVSRQGDNVGFYAYGDSLKAAQRPGERGDIVPRICATLATLEAGGEARHRKLLNYLGESLGRRGVVVIVSDFLDADEAYFKIIKRFRAARHDVVLLHVLDPDELNFPFDGTVRFVDSETAGELVTSPTRVREQYLERFQAHLDGLSTFAARHDVDYHLLPTSQSLAGALAAYLHRREAFR